MPENLSRLHEASQVYRERGGGWWAVVNVILSAWIIVSGM